jgi:ankyrin repeat protein
MKKDWLEATESGDCNRVVALLNDGADINSLDRHGQTALMNAAYRGDTKLLRLLVEKGADLDHTAKYNLSALMLAVINGHLYIVRDLVTGGADTNLKGNWGDFSCTPLEYALKLGRHDIADVLRDRI